jgi:hypothetical protein
LGLKLRKTESEIFGLNKIVKKVILAILQPALAA